MGASDSGRVLPFPLMWGKGAAGADSGAPTSQNSASDEQLVRRVYAAEEGALQALFDRYSRLVLRIALRVIHDHAEAEDVVQEVFLYVHQKAGTFEESKGSAKGWITQLAYHRAFDRRKSLLRKGFYAGTEIGSLADILSGETDLERRLDSSLSHELLVRAIQELPDQQRKTLELFHFEGLELREISERLNEPLANVRHWYYRGLKKLRTNAIVQKLRDSG